MLIVWVHCPVEDENNEYQTQEDVWEDLADSADSEEVWCFSDTIRRTEEACRQHVLDSYWWGIDDYWFPRAVILTRV